MKVAKPQKAIITICLIGLVQQPRVKQESVRVEFRRARNSTSNHHSTYLLARITRSPLLFCRGADIWEVHNGRFHRLLTNAQEPAWSVKRDKIAFVRNGNVWICDSHGRYQRPITDFRLSKNDIEDLKDGFQGTDYGAIQSPTWDVSGRIVAFSRVDRYTVTRNVPPSAAMFNNDISARTKLNISDIYASIPYTRSKPFVWISACTSGLPSFSVTNSSVPSFCPRAKCAAFVRNGDLWLAYNTKLPSKPPPGWATLHDWESGTWNWSEERICPAAIYDGGTGRANSTAFIDAISCSPNGNLIAFSIEGLDESGDGEGIFIYHMRKYPPGYLDTGVPLYAKSRNFVTCFSSCGDWPTFCPDGSFIAYHAIGRPPSNTFDGIVCKSINGDERIVVTRDGHEPAW